MQALRGKKKSCINTEYKEPQMKSLWAASVSITDKMIGLFRRISSLSQGSFAKETYNFIELLTEATPYVRYD